MRVSDHELSTDFLTFCRANTVTVLIPARNEEQTVGKIVTQLARRYCGGQRQLIEIVVIDDHSSDATAAAAAKSGANVIRRTGPDEPTGKAETITEGIRRYPSDIFVLFDADVSNFNPTWLELLCMRLNETGAMLAKGTYHRPVKTFSENRERFFEGGRVTELVARPLLSMCFPELASFGQPLSGEVAFRHELVKADPLCVGYGFDVGLLIDSYVRFGIGSIVEVELGERTHNHQELSALSYQASQVASTILFKAGIDIQALPGAGRLIRPGRPDKAVPFGPLNAPKPI